MSDFTVTNPDVVLTFGAPQQVFVMARRPKTPEDALALFQAFWDVRDPGYPGLTFYTTSPEAAAKLDANPMLQRQGAETTGEGA